MNGKQIGAIITLIILIPTLISLFFWTIRNSNDPGNPENLEKGIEIIADSAIPWWLGIFEKLANINGVIGVALIIGFIYFLKWTGIIG